MPATADITSLVCASFPFICKLPATFRNSTAHLPQTIVLPSPAALPPRTILTELLYILLLASTIPILLTTYRKRQALQCAAHTLATTSVERTTALHNLWLTSDWTTLLGLCDLSLLGSLPSSPWKAANERNLRAYPEKRYLRRLIHMGLVPLDISCGGSGVRLGRRLGLRSAWPWVQMPMWVESESRPYFEFLVPMGRGYSRRQPFEKSQTKEYRELVNMLLANRSGYLVTVSNADWDWPLHFSHPTRRHPPPVEVGSETWVPLLLPFKEDCVLRRSKGRIQQEVGEFVRPGVAPLLDTVKCPLVRVEAAEFVEKRFDEWVFGMAQEAGLGKLFSENELHAYASDWILQNDVKLEERLIAQKDRLGAEFY